MSETIDQSMQGRSVGSTIADPGAWAVTAFASASFMLGMYNAHLVSAGGAAIVIPVAIVFAGVMQVIVAVLEVIRGNVFGAVVFGTYGPFWIIYGLIVQHYAGTLAPASVASALALFLAVFAVLTFYFFIASLKTDVVLAVVFALVCIALAVLAIGTENASTRVTEIGGWITIVFAVLAWYHAAGDVISFTWGRTVLPMGKINKNK
jgi:succinate-acetate transporter protein